MGQIDDFIAGGTSVNSIDDFLAEGKKNRSILDAVKNGIIETNDVIKNYDTAIFSGTGEGITSTEAGLGTFLQAPAANTLSGLIGARELADLGVTAAANWVSPGSAKVNPKYQDAARMASQFAAEERAKPGILNTIGGAMQDDGRARVKAIHQFNIDENPELVRQQQALGSADGFVDTAIALKDNPLAFTHMLARSAPDMVAGAGVAKGVASGLATAGLSGAAQIAGASTTGMLAEAGSSALQAREGVYQNVKAIPVDKLVSDSQRFQELLAENGGDKALAHEALANELADQTPLLIAAGTAAGTLLTNKIFGHDTSAEILSGKRMAAREVPENFLHEGMEEGFQGIPEDTVQHVAMVQADPSHKLDIGGSVVQNFAAGAALGGGGALGAYASQRYGDFKSGRDEAVRSKTGEEFAASELLGAAPSSSPQSAPTEAEKALYTPKNLTALDRVAEIDAIIAASSGNSANDSGVENRADVVLGSSNEGQQVGVGGIDKPGTTQPLDIQSLQAERDQITASWPKASPGAETTFTTETGARLGGQYALMEAGDLTTSHDESLRPTPTYPAELQPRERERHASEMQVQQIVQRLDPARLGESADVATGAPIVGADGLVESGNARTIALKRVYQANGQKAEDYKQYLKDNADRLGITPESVDAMQKPVLVRVRQTPVNRAEFARQANAATVAQMSPSEQARSDSARIDSMDDLTPDENGDFTSGNSQSFVRRFMARLPVTEQAGMIDATGKLSQTGYTRIRNAVLAKAYGDSPVLQRMVESVDDDLRNISKALIRVAPDVAKVRESIGEGALHDVDITPDLMAAVSEMSDLRGKGVSVDQALAQMGMFGEKLSPESRMLLSFLNDNIRSPRRIAEFIQAYMDALKASGNPNQGSLLGDVVAPGKAELLAAAKRNTTNGPDAGTASSADAKGAEAAEESRSQRQDAPGNQVGNGSHEAASPAANDEHLARRAAVDQQWDSALADLGSIVRDYANVARMVPEDTPNLMPTLVKLFEVGIVKVGHNMKDLMAHVKAALKAMPEFKAVWNKINNATYMKAAQQAIANAEAAPQGDLFAAKAAKAAKPQADLFAGASSEAVTKKNPQGIPENWTLAGNKKEWIDENGFVRGLEMPETARAVESKFYDQILNNPDGLIARYQAEILKPEEGLLIDPDRIKLLMPEFVKDERLAHAVHEPSSHLSKVMLVIWADKNIDKPVVFTAGGGGSGKTEAMPVARKVAGINPEGVVFDSTLSSFDSATKKIDRIINRGGKVDIVYTNSPVDKAFRFAMTRSRVVPLTVLAHAHQGASNTIRQLSEHYKGNPSVSVVIVNNFKGIADFHVGSIAEVPHYDYNEIVDKLYDIAKEAKQNGSTTQERFDALVAGFKGFGNPVGRVQEGQSPSEQERHDGRAGRTQEVRGSDAGRKGNAAEGGLNEHGSHSSGGTQGKEPGAAQATDGERGTEGVRDGSGRGNQQSDSHAGNGARVQARGIQETGTVADRESGNPQHRGQDGNGNRSKRNAAVPAGRDIPPKTGRNYQFGDTDLTYTGSWQTKARQNVEAVELLKELQKEGRQATRDEQAILAKFIGWGSSEMANALFGEKLDKQLETLSKYDEAIANLGKQPYLTNSNYSLYKPAFDVLAAKNPALSWYTTGSITKAMLDAAKPDVSARKWGALRDRLKASMTQEEWDAASRSTQYAHYTSKPVVKSLLAAVSKMGFKGGTILEPGAGIGIFPGLMSADMATNSVYTGIEYDPITGGVLKQLFPDERILVESFMDSKLPENFYDVAFGNPPFSGKVTVLSDPKYVKNAFKLHDYFFAKSLDSVKPGGLLVFVTSRYTMDKKGDKARTFMADRADLVGAIRLPQTAFQKNAGTEVVTDVLFLRKKVPGEAQFPHARAWASLGEVKTEKGTALVNQYFVAHPKMVLGTHSQKGSMYGKNEYTVLPKEGDIEAQFAAAVENLPADVFVAGRGSAAEAAKVREMDFNPKAKKEGSFYVTDAGILMQREGGVGMRAEEKHQKNAAILKDYIALRDAVKQSQLDQLNDGDWETSLKTLQKAYAKFTKKNGRLFQNTTYMQKVKVAELDDEGIPTGQKIDDEEQRRRFPAITALRADPEYTLALALENFNEDTGEITDSKWLTERTLGKPVSAEVKTPADALLATLNDTGAVDMAAVAERIGLSEKETIDALGTLVYEDPAQGWVMADEYLSGNVKKKLAAAEEAAKSDKAFARNVEALKAAQPAPRSPEQITPQIGMNWIPGKVYEQFLEDVTGVKAKIEYVKRTREWVLTTLSGEGTPRATVDWGAGDRVHAGWLMEKALSGAAISLNQSVSDGKGGSKQVFDPDRTEAANQKRQELRAKFREWLFQDAQRTTDLVQLYNDKFNTTVQRKFDGTHLTLPGMSKLFHIFDHVKRGAWRVIQTGNTYLAHAVGSGKTLEMVISAMEQKRLGKIKKPMMIVPGHMLQQFASEWQQAYPTARLMVADETDFHTDNRRRFVSRVAMSDLDGVIMTHSSFGLLDLDPVFKQKMIEQELDVMRASYEEAGGKLDEIGDKKVRKDPKIKRIEAQIEKLEQQLAKAMSSEGKDKNVRFDEMGVDMLYVDEAHLFRKLSFATARQTKGIDPNGSQMAWDLYMKTRWLAEKNPTRNLVMASGTAITNTTAELYTVQRFMAPQVLEENGLSGFDDWASQFGEESTSIESTASGKYEPVTRFQNFVNVGEMTQMFRDFADVLNEDHLAALLGDKRPKVVGGGRKTIITPKTETYKTFLTEDLAPRIEKSRSWKPSKDEPYNPDPIIAINIDARLAAIDMRFMDPSLPNDPDSKLNQLIDGVIRVYKETENNEYLDKQGKPEALKGATQMVFFESGFGKMVAQRRGFNARAWMEKRLRDAGIPSTQLAFMEDYKKSSAKLKLFGDVNKGKVRVLVGSSAAMGTGVNAQQRLIALHHLDAPYVPAILEQREGRIVRQGNKNPMVQLYAYSMFGSFDENQWSMLARKKFFIEQALSGDPNIRSIEDVGEVNQLELAAGLVAENPYVMQAAGAKAEVEKLTRLYRSHEEQRGRMREDYDNAGRTIAYNENILPAAEKSAARVKDISGDKFTAMADGKDIYVRKDWGAALMSQYKILADNLTEKKTKIGEISGFDVEFNGRLDGSEYQSSLYLRTPEPVWLAADALADPVGLALRSVNALVDLTRKPIEMRRIISEAKSKRDALESRLDAPFPLAEQLANKVKETADLEAQMMAYSPKKTGLEREQEIEDAWQARTGAITPLLSRGTGRGMALRDLQAVADRVAKGFKNLPRVHVLESPLSLSTKDPSQKALRDFIENHDAMNDAEGGMQDGEIYLFASGVADEARAEHVLATHEITHYGLRGAIGKDLDPALQHVLLMNAKVRKAAVALKEKYGLASNLDAVEEVLADIPNADLVKLRGWRKVVQVVRNWLNKAGATALAAKMDKWLNAGLNEQQQADLFVADMLTAAREWVRTGKGGSGTAHVGGTKLSEQKLADDLAVQEAWLDREARARGFKNIDDLAEKAYPVFEKLAALWRTKHPVEEALLSRGVSPPEIRSSGFDKASGTVIADFKNDQPLKANPDYKAAKAGDVVAAARLVQALVKPESIEAAKAFGDDAIYVPVHAEESAGRNKIPDMLAALYASSGGGEFGAGIFQSNRAYHTGANAMERLLARAEFSGKIEMGRRYVLVDDVTTMGSTLADLANYIRSHGGEVAGSVVLVNAARSGMMIPASKIINELEVRHGEEIRKIFGIEPVALTASEAQYLIGFRTTDELRNRVSTARSERSARLRAKGVSESQGSPGSVEPKLSRASTALPQKTTEQSAEDILQQKAATPRPLDTLTRIPTQALRIDKLTMAAYNKVGALLDRFTPETIKAGFMSDYGIPEAVLDQRSITEGRQRRQLRGAGTLLEKLSTLTRAESRVAYEWMNTDNPQSSDYFMNQLPPESVKVLADVEKMIDDLSKEAVSLGQLDAGAFEKNRFAYLHRSYVKHTAELTKGEAGTRVRAISVLGDQYKGRGMSDPADMAQIKNTAPDWWKRKLQAGKADASLIGEKFIRLERRADAGVGTQELPGIGDRGKGRLLEVSYWPASEPIPAKMQGAWSEAGTWEVSDTKGNKLIMWRDFTKQERVALGEIDEVRYAIAKTLHNMIHDVEVGRYLEWLSRKYAKADGEAIDGTVVEASERMRDTFKPGEWVKVPDSTVTGTKVKKYGVLAGRYLPGPIWNDVRQMGGRVKPFGDVYAAIHGAWKTSKALALDTPIPTPGGWTTMGVIRVGDEVFDERGNVCVVMGATEVQRDRKCYEVAFSDGTKIVADAEHRWFTIMRGNAGVRTTDEIRATLKERTRGDANHKIPVAAALDLPDTELPIPPYALGAWLGDGDTNAARLSVGGDDLDEMLGNLQQSGVRCGKPRKDKRNNVYTVQIKRGHNGCCRGHDRSEQGEKGCRICNNERRRMKAAAMPYAPATNQHVQVVMRDIGLLGNKHIPAEYLRASEDQRRALLHGLMDTDGHVDKRGMCAFTTTLPALRDGVIELVRSLGYKPTLRNFEPECNGKKGKTAWLISFKSYSDKPAFALSRKKARLHGLPARPQRSQTRQIVSITPVKSVPVRCIAVSSKSRLYLAGAGMVPTHNTALSPAVHMNNVMANFVMADWHDVTAGHVLKALQLMTSKDAAAQEVLARFGDAGGGIGTWAVKELQKDQLRPIIDALEKELGIAGNTTGQVGVMSALQLALHGRLPSAWDAFKPSKPGQVATKATRAMLDLYEAEDQVFRLATFLKAKEEGATDLAAGKLARKSFLDYSINAPWVQMMRSTALPFVAFTYRAVPMMLETAAQKPWKLMKLGLLAAAINALGYLLSGGDEDDERKLLPEEKAGRIWGITPKLIRMPWNDANGSPVFLDVRRWIPVGDIFDTGQGHAAIPLLPSMQPGGPLAVIAELALNSVQFTGQKIVLETDTKVEQAQKVADYLYKAFAPNIILLPDTYAWTGAVNAGTGKTDSFGREQSLAQAVVSSVGVKVGSYPKDVLQLNAQREVQAKMMEIDRNITGLKREYQKHGIDAAQFQAKAADQMAKKRAIMEGLQKKMTGK